jgi:uncharacterized protein YdhG (YjbR/CyaY superfamily)
MNSSRHKTETIEEYISAFPPEVRKILESLRKAIHESAPNAHEAISYGMPAFKLNGNLVYFAAYKNHIGFYPSGPSAIEAFKDELTQYEQSKGTIRFPLNRPIPLELVKRMVKFRVQQNESKRQIRTKGKPKDYESE